MGLGTLLLWVGGAGLGSECYFRGRFGSSRTGRSSPPHPLARSSDTLGTLLLGLGGGRTTGQRMNYAHLWGSFLPGQAVVQDLVVGKLLPSLRCSSGSHVKVMLGGGSGTFQARQNRLDMATRGMHFGVQPPQSPRDYIAASSQYALRHKSSGRE